MGNGFIIIINIVKFLYILLMKDDAIFILNYIKDTFKPHYTHPRLLDYDCKA